jgi:hypothetical protein
MLMCCLTILGIRVSTRKIVVITAAAALTVATPPVLHAQEVAHSLDELTAQVKAGDRVTVTDMQGQQIPGTIVALSSSSLRLMQESTPREIVAADIQTITRPHHVSSGKSARIGLLVGAVLGVGSVLFACQGCSYDDSGVPGGAGGMALVAAAGFGGLGALTGIVVSKVIKRPQTIYRSAMKASAKLTIRPILTHHQRGITASVGF